MNLDLSPKSEVFILQYSQFPPNSSQQLVWQVEI